MGERVTKYEYADEDGDIHTLHHVERWCRCSGNCEDNSLEYFDPLDGPAVYKPNVLPYNVQIVGSEMKGAISDLIDMALLSGKLTEVKPNDQD